MSYRLRFKETARKKFSKLNPDIAEQILKKLAKVLENPKIPKNKLSGSIDLYKIKLKSAGYRLVYQVIDDELIVLVLDVDRRDTIYKNM
ncbi:type II toxin-antitoxin system RelE/ParE family toxin [uncultured Acinetobacter sp.]|uniref:type II toxin-antitoxin system RelE family toxin n=1 Tax=uncultured Acinetobacter sp. TaxID=165433 RepID=UPI0025D3E4D0|nr:type II toxin-antitoxin system RelE/ParE family toxin [uncultured Acinetobacter sp.]